MRILTVLSIVLLASVPAAGAERDALWSALKQGGRVALVRHTDAPGGAGDPPGFQRDDCKTQRNLSEKGRAQARALGEEIRARGVPVGKVLASQWCRCRETAALLNIGTVEEAAAFNNAYVLRDQRAELTEGARSIIAAWQGPGTLVVVTHGANVLALAGIQPAEGAIVVVEPRPGSEAKFRVLGQLPPGS